ncbi:MAG: alternate-type signal peptide domain-containing protein [Cryobacterium sp.]|nr:alternate-type signal peptide domain-containing protein [Cryobacterium sp.]
MNKLTKAAIAGAAGIALLLGGAGSLALWNATDTVNAGSINTGTLTMTATAGTWNTAPTNWVPGDSYEYTASVSVTAVGDHIKGTLSVDPSSITGDAGLIADVTITLTVTGTLPANVTSNGDGTYNIAAAGTYVLPVKVTAAFKSTSLNATQGKTINLTGLAFRVDQHL